jgi:hypothetical protein
MTTKPVQGNSSANLVKPNLLDQISQAWKDVLSGKYKAAKSPAKKPITKVKQPAAQNRPAVDHANQNANSNAKPRVGTDARVTNVKPTTNRPVIKPATAKPNSLQAAVDQTWRHGQSLATQGLRHVADTGVKNAQTLQRAGEKLGSAVNDLRTGKLDRLGQKIIRNTQPEVMNSRIGSFGSVMAHSGINGLSQVGQMMKTTAETTTSARKLIEAAPQFFTNTRDLVTGKTKTSKRDVAAGTVSGTGNAFYGAGTGTLNTLVNQVAPGFGSDLYNYGVGRVQQTLDNKYRQKVKQHGVNPDSKGYKASSDLAQVVTNVVIATSGKIGSTVKSRLTSALKPVIPSTLPSNFPKVTNLPGLNNIVRHTPKVTIPSTVPSNFPRVTNLPGMNNIVPRTPKVTIPSTVPSTFPKVTNLRGMNNIKPFTRKPNNPSSISPGSGGGGPTGSSGTSGLGRQGGSGGPYPSGRTASGGGGGNAATLQRPAQMPTTTTAPIQTQPGKNIQLGQGGQQVPLMRVKPPTNVMQGGSNPGLTTPDPTIPVKIAPTAKLNTGTSGLSKPYVPTMPRNATPVVTPANANRPVPQTTGSVRPLSPKPVPTPQTLAPAAVALKPQSTPTRTETSPAAHPTTPTKKQITQPVGEPVQPLFPATKTKPKNTPGTAPNATPNGSPNTTPRKNEPSPWGHPATPTQPQITQPIGVPARPLLPAATPQPPTAQPLGTPSSPGPNKPSTDKPQTTRPTGDPAPWFPKVAPVELDPASKPQGRGIGDRPLTPGENTSDTKKAVEEWFKKQAAKNNQERLQDYSSGRITREAAASGVNPEDRAKMNDALDQIDRMKVGGSTRSSSTSGGNYTTAGVKDVWRQVDSKGGIDAMPESAVRQLKGITEQGLKNTDLSATERAELMKRLEGVNKAQGQYHKAREANQNNPALDTSKWNLPTGEVTFGQNRTSDKQVTQPQPVQPNLNVERSPYVPGGSFDDARQRMGTGFNAKDYFTGANTPRVSPNGFDREEVPSKPLPNAIDKALQARVRLNSVSEISDTARFDAYVSGLDGLPVPTLVRIGATIPGLSGRTLAQREQSYKQISANNLEPHVPSFELHDNPSPQEIHELHTVFGSVSRLGEEHASSIAFNFEVKTTPITSRADLPGANGKQLAAYWQPFAPGDWAKAETALSRLEGRRLLRDHKTVQENIDIMAEGGFIPEGSSLSKRLKKYEVAPYQYNEAMNTESSTPFDIAKARKQDEESMQGIRRLAIRSRMDMLHEAFGTPATTYELTVRHVAAARYLLSIQGQPGAVFSASKYQSIISEVRREAGGKDSVGLTWHRAFIKSHEANADFIKGMEQSEPMRKAWAAYKAKYAL